MNPSLCQSCDHAKPVISGRGSRFLLCEKAASDHRFPKYPMQPVIQCAGFRPNEPKETDSA